MLLPFPHKYRNSLSAAQHNLHLALRHYNYIMKMFSTKREEGKARIRNAKERLEKAYWLIDHIKEQTLKIERNNL